MDEQIKNIVELALKEDLGDCLTADITSQLLDAEIETQGAIISKEPGVLAGVDVANLTFQLLDAEIELKWHHGSGDVIAAQTPICEIAGRLTSIAAGERVALNFLSHLSGIATLTRKFVDMVDGRTEIYDTRKTTPGLRVLEKSAVLAGGGKNHRFSLQDAILVKDNHLAHIDIKSAVHRARKKHPNNIFVEIECDTIQQVQEALEAGADAVLLDNMTPKQVSECVQLVDGKCITEASGNINLETVVDLSRTGVDRISVGAITKSAIPLDMGLDITT